MSPDTPEEENAAEGRLQRRENRERRQAIHTRLRGKGQTRTIFLRERDYVTYDTQVWNMAGEGFPIFWLTDAYGGELFEPFERLAGQTIYDYLWRATIVRRQAMYNDPELVEPVILVDLDQCEGIVRIPSEVWQYAFEKHKGLQSFEMNPGAEQWINRDEVVAANKDWYPPKTTVQVIFASARSGILIKGPVTLLLLLAQDKVPIENLQWGDLDELATKWGKVWSLQESCAAVLKKQGEDTGGIDVLNIVLEFPKERLVTLAQLVEAGTSQVIRWFVNDVWVLWTGEALQKHEEITGRISLVEGTNFAQGDPYEWALVHAGFWEQKVRASWVDTPRIARCEFLGGKYYLNTTYATWAARPDISWEQVERMHLLKPRKTHIHPLKLGAAGEVFKIRPTIPEEYASLISKAAEFNRFYSDIFQRTTELVEKRDGWFLYRDTEAIEVDGEPEILQTDLVVKDIGSPANVKPYCGGLQGFLDLFTLNGHPVRWFTLYPWSECVERESSVLRDLLQSWLGGASTKVDFIARSLLKVREDSLLNVDILLGDLLANIAVQEHVTSPQGIRSVVNVWQYNAVEGRYAPVVKDTRKVAEVKELYEKVASGEYKKENPLLWCAELSTFAEDHPEEYKRLMEEMAAQASEEHLPDVALPDEPEAELFEDDREVEAQIEKEHEEEDEDFDWDAWWEDPYGDAVFSKDAEPGEPTASWGIKDVDDDDDDGSADDSDDDEDE